MLLYTKIIDVNRPIEDHIADAKNYLRRMHEGDFIDWATLAYDTEVRKFEGMDLTVMTVTVESALSLATTFDTGDPS